MRPLFLLITSLLSWPISAQMHITAYEGVQQDNQIGYTITANKTLFERAHLSHRYVDTLLLDQKIKSICYLETNEIEGVFTINGKEVSFPTSQFSSEIIDTDTLIFSFLSTSKKKPFFVLKELGVLLDPVQKRMKKGFGDSGNCLLNVNCDEGDDWDNQKRSVVKIRSKIGRRLFECTGVLVNNTLEDKHPYILTAEHCANIENTSIYATDEDLINWKFYFNYESAICAPPSSENEVTFNTLTGARLVAQSEDQGGDFGSDFFLVELLEAIPTSFNPFYAGWDSEDIPAPSGVTIHHPNSDLKKISTFTTPTVSDESIEGTPNAHWRVLWSATKNGHSITEGGSSGAPLFNNQGLVIGTLNGGYSSCSNPTGFDYYGKLSYSWASNGTKETQQLKNFLAPNSSITSLEGKNHDDTVDVSPPEVAPTNFYAVYPNPTSGAITVKGDFFESATVISNEGITIGSYQTKTFDLSEVPKGCYLLKVNYSDNQKTFRIARY